MIRTRLILFFAAAALSAGSAFSQTTEPETLKNPNVLFIMVDDLRPEIGAYGNTHVKTPNIDKLAGKGITFNRAYCQYSLCNPSRSSLLSGLRPETIKVYDLGTHVDAHVPDVVTLPEHFKSNGYETVRVGKIFHVGHGNRERVEAWTATEKNKPEWTKPPIVHHDPKTSTPAERRGWDNGEPLLPDHSNKMPYDAPDVADGELHDGKLAKEAINKLKNRDKSKPLFLAVGFHKPHLPFIAPKKYWDLYDEKAIPAAENNFHPKDSPLYAGNDMSELRRYKNVPFEGPISDDMARKLKHGYYACVSYVDAQIGRILKNLEKEGIADNTIIVLWGDHGYQLGEHGTWSKRTNWETGTRVPLIISAPGRKNQGKLTDALAETVDIYPTLSELAGLPAPKKTEGYSLEPVLNNPTIEWKNAAFSCILAPAREGNRKVFGRTIRTDSHRLVEWEFIDKPETKEYELYDLTVDPDENINIAKSPKNADLVKELTNRLHQGWKAALPKTAQE